MTDHSHQEATMAADAETEPLPDTLLADKHISYIVSLDTVRCALQFANFSFLYFII